MKPHAVIAFSVQQMTCTACGAEANASCNCGKPYMPKKQRVAEYDKENPRRSTRQAAADLGMSKSTVSDARQGVQDRAPEVEGRDGKVYRLPIRQEPEETGDTPEQIWERGLKYRASEAVAGATFSNWTAQYGDYTKFQITSELVTLAEQAASAWGELANHLRGLK